MREILFRGKRTDNGEWVYGDVRLNYDDEPRCISDYCGANPVDPATVGQYTGLTDKNGKKIFEGDIVFVKDRLMQDSEPLSTFMGTVDHKDASFVIVGDVFTHYRWLDYEVEVIGNIHDNPELLKGDNDV